MLNRMNRLLKLVILIIIIVLLVSLLLNLTPNKLNKYFLGGDIFSRNIVVGKEDQEVLSLHDFRIDRERFQRPSKEPALDLKYRYNDLLKGYPEKYSTAIDVIHSYYSMLKEASNTIGFQGGCGTIGMGREPYTHAYELLSNETKKDISYEKFLDSFEGVGHITLLKLYPAYESPSTPSNIKHYIVEIEVITGPPREEGEEYNSEPTYFAYYYGIITAVYEGSNGWKIKSVDYIPEDFLCAPYHLWDWDGKMFVEIVYRDWYNLISKIDNVEKNESIVSVYASGNGKEYKFDFIRLTNGEDILVHEFVKEYGKWTEVNILRPEHQGYKLSVSNFN
ncbi:hypothetical protein [Sporosalibacterium faouarense]|uniref:hypothetical protein n=1 Tax=Sporosalibacterium faouarense TaxID=516123 RepID=UPI00192A745D|nr:hypothetical protein [Sporosalibacterium faouarense]